MDRKVKLYWSKTNKDWTFTYPDIDGKMLMGVFFDMVKTTGHRTDWKSELRNMLQARGYDPDTLKITCKKLNNSQQSK